MRRFEIVKGVENVDDVKKPQRSTKHSAGYDFFAMEDVEIKPIPDTKVVFVKTGVKAKFGEDEVLKLYNRSSNTKKGLILANGVGVIDSDYYNNENNDGEIIFAFCNISNETIIIHKGDKIGQGIFEKFLLTDDDEANAERVGGFGSTGV